MGEYFNNQVLGNEYKRCRAEFVDIIISLVCIFIMKHILFLKTVKLHYISLNIFC